MRQAGALISVEVKMPRALEQKALDAVWRNGCLWGALLMLAAFVIFGRDRR